MDVRCSRCGVEYEFDDEKVKPSGVTVKCTSCGHVFKVSRATAEDSAPFMTSPSGEGWMVRHRDGTVTRFKELTTLQKWIVEQKVGSNDEISRTGRTWRPLGDIAELASFFDVVEAANAARHAQLAEAPTAPPQPAQPPREALPERVPTAPFPTPGPAAQGLPLATTEASEPGVRTPPAGPRERQAPAIVPVPPEAEMGFYRAEVDELDDEDPVLAWRRRARRRNAALVTLVLLVGGGLGLFFLARPTFDRLLAGGMALVGLEAPAAVHAGPTRSDDAEAELLRRVSAALLGRADGQAALLAELTTAVQDENAPAVSVAALSQLHAAAAMRASDEARLLERLLTTPSPTEDLPGRLEDAKKRAAHHLAEAYSLASRARTSAPELADADLAFAAYQAAKGAAPEAGADVEAARRHAGADERVAREAAAIVALAGALAAKDDAGRSSATEAVAKASAAAPDDVRLREAALVLAALSPAPVDAPSARSAAEAWHREAANDPRPALILSLLPAPQDAAPFEKAEAPAATGDAAKDADAPDAAAAASDHDDDDTEAKGSEPLDYEALLKRADKSRIRERTSAALKLYKQAVDLRPQAAKPHVGMGWCYLDLENNRAAVDAFAYAIILDKDLGEAHFGLAEAQRYSGKKEAALRSYKRYLELSPSGPDAPVARNAIQSLEQELQ